MPHLPQLWVYADALTKRCPVCGAAPEMPCRGFLRPDTDRLVHMGRLRTPSRKSSSHPHTEKRRQAAEAAIKAREQELVR